MAIFVDSIVALNEVHQVMLGLDQDAISAPAYKPFDCNVVELAN